jgi:hypothetical protein
MASDQSAILLPIALPFDHPDLGRIPTDPYEHCHLRHYS